MKPPDHTARVPWTRYLLPAIGLAMVATSAAGGLGAFARLPPSSAAARIQGGEANQWTEQRPAADADHDVGPGEAEPVLVGGP